MLKKSDYLSYDSRSKKHCIATDWKQNNCYPCLTPNLTGARGAPHVHKGGKTGPQNFRDKKKLICSLQIFFLGCREVNNYYSVNCGVKPCIIKVL